MNSDADRHVQVIGIGAGDRLADARGVRALEALDVAFVFQKGADDELAAARRALLPTASARSRIEDPPRGRGPAVAAARERYGSCARLSPARTERGLLAGAIRRSTTG